MSEPAEFSRPLGVPHALRFAAALIAAVAGLTWIGFFVLDGSWFTRALPMPKVAVKLTGEALTALPVLFLPVLALVLIRRRFGRCLLSDDSLAFSPPFAGGLLSFPLAAVTDRRVTPHGVLVHIPGRSAQAQRLCPLLIPTADEADEARVLSLLDQRPEHVPFERTRQSLAHNAFLALAVSVPFLLQFSVVGAFTTMFKETGISLPFLTELLITGRLLVGAAAMHIFAIALGGTWAPGRVTSTAWFADAVYVACVAVALFLPLIQMLEKL